MNFKKLVSKFLTSKIVLNIVTILAVLNVIGYLSMGKYNAVLIFIVLGILLKYFSKNMIIVLGVPLILVNLLAMRGNIEGMDNNKTTTTSESASTDKTTDDGNQTQTVKDVIQKQIISKINQQDKKSSQGLPMTHVPEDANTSSTSTGRIKSTTDTTTEDTTTEESFEVGRAKKRGGYEIDYATTIEDAYDELNKVLGSDGIKRLTDDTQKLMKQQMQLAEAMNSMTPLIQGMGPLMEKAEGLLGGMNDGKGMSGIMNMAKKLSGGNADK